MAASLTSSAKSLVSRKLRTFCQQSSVLSTNGSFTMVLLLEFQTSSFQKRKSRRKFRIHWVNTKNKSAKLSTKANQANWNHNLERLCLSLLKLKLTRAWTMLETSPAILHLTVWGHPTDCETWLLLAPKAQTSTYPRLWPVLDSRTLKVNVFLLVSTRDLCLTSPNLTSDHRAEVSLSQATCQD